MIDYKRLDDPEYFNKTINDIKTLSDQSELENILKSLSVKLYHREIEPIYANMLLGAIKSRRSVLAGGRRQRQQEGDTIGTNDKVLKLTPTPPSTSISSKAGTVSIVFLVVNIAITTVMYTLLILSRSIK